MVLPIPGTATKDNTRRNTPLWRQADELANKSGPRRTVYWPSGDTYIGCWKDNLCHGKGRMQYASGDRYEGEWRAGLRHGLGTLWRCRAGAYVVHYHGMWAADRPEGLGVAYAADGGMFRGEWRKGLREGPGMLRVPNAQFGGHDVYEGEWKEDKRTGRGTISYANGNLFEGCFRDDQRNGLGSYFDMHKRMRYDGNWVDDVARSGAYSAIEEGSTPNLPYKELPEIELVDPNAVLMATLMASCGAPADGADTKE